MVLYQGLEGGCWLIRAEDGQRFFPTNLATEFREDSLLISASVELREDLNAICTTAPVVEIRRIERR